MKKVYVTALTDSLLSGVSFETSLLNLKRVLKEKGHTRLLSQILRASSRELVSKQQRQFATITLADADSVSLEKMKAILKSLGADENRYYSVIDPTLIGGFTVRTQSQYLDASYKNALLNLYRKVTKS
jgi:F0F1-type ATP synthase delta subunit